MFQSSSCAINCSYFAYTIETISTIACSCSTVFYWDNQCKINCILVNQSNGTVPNTVNQCFCNDKYYFDVQQLKCVLNCSSIKNAVGTSPTIHETCVCRSRYMWIS